MQLTSGESKYNVNKVVRGEKMPSILESDLRNFHFLSKFVLPFFQADFHDHWDY